MTRRLFVCSAGLVLFAAACGDARSVSTGQQPGASAVGPTNTTPAQCAAAGLTGLTYASFGQNFFSSFCLRCHSVNVTGAARNGAPTDHNFDKLSDVQGLKDQIDQVAGMNPNGSVKNTTMPFNPPAPPDPDRQKLSCWIAAGLP
jgi:cytochrome c5